MAIPPETSFSSLLRADSEQPLPDTDKGVVDLLNSYGATFKKGKTFAPERLNLLAGLMWVHAHRDDLHVVWSTASAAQHRLLATALRLNYDELSMTEPWLTMVVRRVLANILPGATPEKRKAPIDGADGQIRVPGAGPAPLPPPAAKKSKAKPSKKKKAKATKSSSSSSLDGDSDSDSSAASAPETILVDVDPSAALARMPKELGSGAEFNALVAARCKRSWLPLNVIENGLPAAYRSQAVLAKLWSSKERQAYDKMIKLQKPERGRDQRRENPVQVACPHRLSFTYDRDDAVHLEAQHLVMVCAGESLSDWAGEDARLFGGTRGKAEYEYALKELNESWVALNTAFERNHQIGAPASSALFTRVFNLLARRYDRFAAILSPGRVREEILANVARQLAEIRVYFDAFNRSLADRCGRKAYDDQAHYAGVRYVRLLRPVVTFLLDAEHGTDDCGPAGGFTGGAGAGGGMSGGGGFGMLPAAPSPAARRKLAVTFADGPGAGSPPSAAQGAFHLPASAAPAAYQLTSPGPGGWPGYPMYSAYPAAYYPPTGAGFSPPTPGPPVLPAVAGGPWCGYAGPISGSPGSAAAAAPPAAVSPPAAASAKAAVKPEPGAPAGLHGFLAQPMHVYVTGTNYNVVPAGECRTPPCGCGAKHGPNYKPGPHATWDCPFRYISRYGSCPGFLSSGQRNPDHWTGDALTRRAKDEWVKLITKLNLPLPSGAEFRPVNFAL
jgi:hypothetical protein